MPLWLPKPKTLRVSFHPRGDDPFVVTSTEYSFDGVMWLPMVDGFKIPAHTFGADGGLHVRMNVARGPHTFSVVSD